MTRISRIKGKTNNLYLELGENVPQLLEVFC